ncbi:MAG: coenzyme F420-0:L-glutamate ligase [Anaerolineae bacterium]|nr:coenzyme F420-0:L-glutamate ligase [Anaerolineae bacterium]
MPNTQVTLQAIPDFPLVQPGDDLVALIVERVQHASVTLQAADILVISSKIVSKAENRFLDLRQVNPSSRALELAHHTQKDPRLVEVVLQNSQAIARTAPNVLIVRHLLGFTSANAGIDQSNLGYDLGKDVVLLLPANPDATARALRAHLEQHFGVTLGIIISDTHGRPFRLGNLNVAIGLAGVPALVDQRGQADLFGRTLRATITPLADELAAAAGLISGQADEGQPVVLIRGVAWEPSADSAAQLIRPAEQDLYR